MRSQIAVEGFALGAELANSRELEGLLDGLSRVPAGESVRVRRREAYAIRNVLDLVPEVAEWVQKPAVRDAVRAALGRPGVPVKATLFDKTPAANWNVGWHQDLTIAVAERREVEGFHSWSLKAGVPHVQPPACVLEEMVALRLHLDPCGAANGALRVLPGSHRAGRLSSAAVRAWVAAHPPVVCESSAGRALLMRPLLLHASSPAAVPGHRRVLHIEFAAGVLAGGLRWRTTPAGRKHAEPPAGAPGPLHVSR